MAHKHGYVPAVHQRDVRVDHITVRISDLGADGATYALIAGDAASPKDRKPLFTGTLTRDMARDLRALSLAIGEILDQKEGAA